jgi:hypothetical protein
MAVNNAMEMLTRTFCGPESPALLVSYVIIDDVLKEMPNLVFRDWVLDSGAYSAFTLGKEIRLQDYIDFCKRMRGIDRPPTEVFALDVIGDWKGSLKNTEEMWRQGVEAVPCYHEGEPWHVLQTMAREYPKIALGGMVGAPGNRKLKWVKECFARVWPKRIHGFGVFNQQILHAVPFESVDSANWAYPMIGGNWIGIGHGKWVVLRTRKTYDLRAEVRYYMKLERKLKFLWRRELAAIGSPGVSAA